MQISGAPDMSAADGRRAHPRRGYAACLKASGMAIIGTAAGRRK